MQNDEEPRDLNLQTESPCQISNLDLQIESPNRVPNCIYKSSVSLFKMFIVMKEFIQLDLSLTFIFCQGYIEN